jgi:uncharacterized protein YkwD
MRPTVRRRLPLSVVLGLLGLAFLALLQWQPARVADAAGALPGDPAFMLQLTAEQSLFDLTNTDRAANGVAPLAEDPDLLDIARNRAASQLGAAPLTHYDPDGGLAFVRLLNTAQLGYQLAGENLARASAVDGTLAQRIELALMNSPLHRKNILERQFSRVAIGAATDSSGQVSFAEIYRN